METYKKVNLGEVIKTTINNISEEEKKKSPVCPQAIPSWDTWDALDSSPFATAEEIAEMKRQTLLARRSLSEDELSFKVGKDLLSAEFDRYIDRRRHNLDHSENGKDDIYTAGECREAERFLKIMGVNMDDSRIQDLIEGRRQVFSSDFDILVETEDDFVLMSANPYKRGECNGYIVIWLHHSAEKAAYIVENAFYVSPTDAWSKDGLKVIRFISMASHSKRYAESSDKKQMLRHYVDYSLLHSVEFMMRPSTFKYTPERILSGEFVDWV